MDSRGAVDFERRALYYAYQTPKLALRIVSHANLAVYMSRDGNVHGSMAHRLASVIYCVLTGLDADAVFTGLLHQWQQSGLDLEDILPGDFDALSQFMLSDADVPFGETVYELTGGRDLAGLTPAMRQKLIEFVDRFMQQKDL